LTNGKGVDHVIEVGGAGTLMKSLKCTRPGGLVSVIGILTEDEEGALSREFVWGVLFGGKIGEFAICVTSEAWIVLTYRCSEGLYVLE
jgi:NADPH:quinone reductase-like Zn-dependent oxidoreductase